MPATAASSHQPDATAGGTWNASLPIIVPPLVWVGSLALSWVIEDFSCAAALTTGRELQETAVFAALVSVNAVLLLITIICGLISIRAFRRAGRTHSPLMRFLGLAGIAVAVLFGFGIVMIGSTPFMLEVCR